MPEQQGTLLAELLARGDTPAGADLRQMLLPLLDALENLHTGGVVHQQVSPEQIFITANGRPLLTGLGGGVTADPDSMTESTGPCTAPEQVRGGEIGPWTDLYGLAATLYHCVTGQPPPSAGERLAAVDAALDDPLAPAGGLLPVSEYGGLGEAIDQGLALDPDARPRDAASWRKAFQGLDWRLMVAGREADDIESEGREWLPMTLLAVFLVTLVGITIFLFTDLEYELPGLPEATSEADRDADSGRPAGITPEERRRWQAALEADTVLGYRRFMEDFPQSVYLEQAQLQLDILDEKLWEELSAEDTRESYEDYLEVFPDGQHQAEALRRIEAIDAEAARLERVRIERERQDHAAWEAARQERTIESMDRYIDAWPGGLHIEEAQRTRRQLVDQANDDTAFQTAGKLNTRDAFQAYLDAFPQGAHVTAALQKVDELTMRPGKFFRDCLECPQMVVVPAGTFRQGSAEDAENAQGIEQPQRTVSIAEPFAIGVYEVTLAEWDACVAAGNCSLRPSDNGWGRGQRPVMLVSWNDVQEYLAWLSEHTGQAYRLPSESEWEYAARAGQEGDWPGGGPQTVCFFGNVAGSESGLRWQHESCGDEQALGTRPAGSYRANRFGLHDVIGNVAEWTLDCLNLSYLDAPVDGSAWTRGICSSHMTRGGSWVTGSRDIRLPARFNLKNGDRNDFTGFRVVRTIEE